MSKKNIEIVDLARQFKDDYLSYGMYVIEERALPDVRDGLKPVQRRSLYVLHESGLSPNKPHQKSARVVGNIMGKYHPHGDSGIYDSIQTMARWWRSPIPYIEGKGNFGNIKGDSAAAMRYTEVRLSKYGQMLTEGVYNGSTKFVPNYDDSEREPEVLPIKYPTLLINGNFGIAVGMTSNCMPHNPVEVMNAVIAYMKNPKIKLPELMKYLPGPDFPSGGVILDSDELIDYYELGEKRLTIKGKTKIEGNKVIITEVPWTLSGSSETLKDNIYQMIENKKLKNARSVNDFTNKHGIQIEVTAKNKDQVKQLEKELYAKTKLTSRFSASFLVIHEGAPKNMGLLEYFDIYTDYQHKILIRESKQSLEKTKKRLEVVDGLIDANKVIGVIIEVIRNAKKQEDIRKCLLSGDTQNLSFKTKKSEGIAKKFTFSNNQVDAILSMQLRRLSNLDQSVLIKEKKSLEKDMELYEGYIQSKTKRKNRIIKNHELILKEFGEYPRRTDLSNQSFEEYEDKVSAEPILITIDRFGYIKSLAPDAKVEENDIYQYKTTSIDEIGFFSSDSNFYKIKLDELKTSSKGQSIAGMIGLPTSEYLFINQIGDPILFSEKDGSILFVTENGLAKRVKRSEFLSSRKKTVGTKLKKDDRLIAAQEWTEKDYIVFISKNALVKKINSNDIKEYGKNSQGTIVSRPVKDDTVTIVYQVNDDDIINIKGKDIKVSDIPEQQPSHSMKRL